MSCGTEETHSITLAEDKRVGSVSMCGCGTIHLSLGAVSLRVSPDVLVAMTRMLNAAAGRLVENSRALEPASAIVH